jgi:hypothetical protein
LLCGNPAVRDERRAIVAVELLPPAAEILLRDGAVDRASTNEDYCLEGDTVVAWHTAGFIRLQRHAKLCWGIVLQFRSPPTL